MSFFDLFNGISKFEQGMDAGANPYRDKYVQYAGALNQLKEQNGDQWNRTKEVAFKLLDRLDAIDKQRLYGLNTQIDIKQLKSECKEILIATLYTLSSESNNEFQQSYIRSVQKYLDIKNPQTSIDFSGIGNIDSQTAQKAVFQSCVEYLLLGSDGPDFFEKYAEKLFSHFVIKEKDMVEIWGNVLQIYTATGPLGLAEKYGFVPTVPIVPRKVYSLPSSDGSGEGSILEKQVIEEVLLIRSDQEMTIEGKEITLKDDIYCEGKLTLKDCILFYNGDNIEGRILLLDDNSVLTLNCCTVVGKNNTKRAERPDKWLIVQEQGPKAREMQNIKSQRRIAAGNNSKFKAQKCLFLDCFNFINGVESEFTDSIVRYSKAPVFPDKRFGDDSKQGIHFVTAYDTRPVILERCIIEGDETTIASYDGETLIGVVRSVKSCMFVNVSKPFSTASSYNPDKMRNVNSIVQNSRFINCRYPIIRGGERPEYLVNKPGMGGLGSDVDISDCIFENCHNVIDIYSGSVENCQFIRCGNFIIICRGGARIENNQFIDIRNPTDEEFDPRIREENWDLHIGSFITGWGISIFNRKDGYCPTIKNCTFDGINHAGFIRYKFDRDLAFIRKHTVYSISDCEFKHCVADIIDKRNYEESTTENIFISISNCTGLEDTDGGQAENPVIRQETANGEPIGANIDEAEVGVPICQTA
jgi:hypothetical protein